MDLVKCAIFVSIICPFVLFILRVTILARRYYLLMKQLKTNSTHSATDVPAAQTIPNNSVLEEHSCHMGGKEWDLPPTYDEVMKAVNVHDSLKLQQLNNKTNRAEILNVIESGNANNTHKSSAGCMVMSSPSRGRTTNLGRVNKTRSKINKRATATSTSHLRQLKSLKIPKPTYFATSDSPRAVQTASKKVAEPVVEEATTVIDDDCILIEPHVEVIEILDDDRNDDEMLYPEPTIKNTYNNKTKKKRYSVATNTSSTLTKIKKKFDADTFSSKNMTKSKHIEIKIEKWNGKF